MRGAKDLLRAIRYPPHRNAPGTRIPAGSRQVLSANCQRTRCRLPCWIGDELVVTRATIPDELSRPPATSPAFSP